MRNYYQYILLIFSALKVNAQETKTFIFEPRDSNFIDSNYVARNSKSLSFSINRDIKDSIYIDRYLLCRAKVEECELKYRPVENGDWLIYFRDKKALLFSSNKNEILKSTFFNDSVMILPVISKKINNETFIHAFRIVNMHWNQPENNIYYWFNPKYGIVAIEDPQILLVRRDFTFAIKGNLK